MSDVIQTRHKIISHAPTEEYREGYDNINWRRASDDSTPEEDTNQRKPQTFAGCPIPASDAFRRATGR